MNCTPKEGYALWRSLARDYEPKIGSRSASLLVHLPLYKFDIGDFQNSHEKWENLIKRYDGTARERRRVAGNREIASLLATRLKTYPDNQQ
eukprot:2246557-Amphidinium_carterae.2